jgi:uncharacterized protein
VTPLEMLVLLLGGAAGAGLARLLRLPMWPITGSIVGAAVVHAVVGGAVVVPAGWGLAGQALVGISVGSAISPHVLRHFRILAAPGTLAVTTIVALGLGGGAAIAATGQLAPTEAVLGMVPGGVGEMVAAATALDTDAAVVAGMHVVRLLVVVSVIPLLVRWAGRWQRPPDPQEP